MIIQLFNILIFAMLCLKHERIEARAPPLAPNKKNETIEPRPVWQAYGLQIKRHGASAASRCSFREALFSLYLFGEKT